jgi:PKHD-type hydroxylase
MKYTYWSYEKFFSLKQIKELNLLCNEKKDLNVKDNHQDKSKKISEVIHVQWLNIKKELATLDNYIDVINQEYFGFDIYSMNDMHYVSHNTYKGTEKGIYDYHTDGFISDKCNPIKLTCLINTSEKKFEGGDFYIFLDGPILIKNFNEPGSILIFPSLFSHKVSEITKGTRTSISLWRRGPHFK